MSRRGKRIPRESAPADYDSRKIAHEIKVS
jgi:hypothetical protein